MGIADRFKNGISRRGFVLGGAATGTAAVLAGCSKKTGTSDDAAGEPQVIKDDSKIVSITDEYEAVDIDLEPAASWTLPLGTLLYYCDDGACFCPACQYAWCAQSGRWLAYHTY